MRKVFFEEQGHSVDDHVESLGCTVGEELLRPTRIYVESLLNVLRRQRINGLVHITGGGFIDNIPRILPAGCDAHIQVGSWPVPPVFAYLQEKGSISAAEMYRTFNMGIGMMAIVAESSVEDLLHQLKAHGEEPFLIGEIRAARGGAGRQVVLEGID